MLLNFICVCDSLLKRYLLGENGYIFMYSVCFFDWCICKSIHFLCNCFLFSFLSSIVQK